jgi:two-component system, OmpR family, response regulator MtrA
VVGGEEAAHDPADLLPSHRGTGLPNVASGTETVLVVEDEVTVRKLMARALLADGLEVVAVPDSRGALTVLATRRFDLVLLDIRLPDMNGLELCREVVSRYDIPVIFVTAKDDDADIVRGFEVGAVDYIKKPFEIHELRARVTEQLQRSKQPRPESVFHLDDLVIDPATGEVSRGGKPVHLTMTEFRLLVELARHRGTVISRDELLEHIWTSSDIADSRLVDMAIARLRKKIEMDPSRPQIIKTVRGRGYTVE